MGSVIDWECCSLYTARGARQRGAATRRGPSADRRVGQWAAGQLRFFAIPGLCRHHHLQLQAAACQRRLHACTAVQCWAAMCGTSRSRNTAPTTHQHNRTGGCPRCPAEVKRSIAHSHSPGTRPDESLAGNVNLSPFYQRTKTIMNAVRGARPARNPHRRHRHRAAASRSLPVPPHLLFRPAKRSSFYLIGSIATTVCCCFSIAKTPTRAFEKTHGSAMEPVEGL